MLAHHFLGFFQAQTRYPAAEAHAEFFLDEGGEVGLVGIQPGGKIIYRELVLQIRFLLNPFRYSRAQRFDVGFLRLASPLFSSSVLSQSAFISVSYSEV